MADEDEIAGQEQSGGGKKLILIIVVIAVLLLGAGAAAYFLLGAAEDETAAAGTDSAEAVAAEEGEPLYYKLDPTFVVNLPPGGPNKMLQVAIEVMTRTPTVIETLTVNNPMIRHHLLNLLEQQQAADLLTVEGKQSLQMALHELLSEKLVELKEPGVIKGVFFTQFVMQ